MGDIIACSQLAYKLIQALKDSGGAQTVYQALINDLSSIHRSLLEVTQMHHASQLSTATVNAILYEAHSLTKIMDDYLATIEAYHSALSGLSAKSSANRYRDMVKKLRWSFAETGAVQALRNRLASHSQSIITLIAVATLYMYHILGAWLLLTCLGLQQSSKRPGRCSIQPVSRARQGHSGGHRHSYRAQTHSQRCRRSRGWNSRSR